MSRTRRLQPVMQHTDKKEQGALRKVAKCQALLEVEKNKLAQLEQYRIEYLQQSQQQAAVNSAHELQEFQRFLQQLEATIAAQQALIEQRQRELEQKRQEWKVMRIDAKVMHKVVEKLQHQETVEAEREEQKEQDDITQITQRRNHRD